MALAVAEFFLLGLGGPLTYDEANYLQLAMQIRESGWPIWFWHPDRPAIFAASPPLILYALAAVQTLFGNGAAGARFLYFGLCAVPATGLVYWLTRRDAGPVGGATSASLMLLSGVWIFEMVRVRFDLPLAAVGFALLYLLAEGLSTSESSHARSWRWRAIAIAALSILGITIKYQFATVTGTILLVCGWVLITAKNPQQRRQAVTYLGVHLLSLALAIFGLWLFYQAAAGAIANDSSTLTNAIEGQVGNRILPTGNIVREVSMLLEKLGLIAIKIGIPIVLVFCVALGNGPSREGDREASSSDTTTNAYFSLTEGTMLAFCLMVVAFNVLTYRIFGGQHYMTQLMPPLAYLFGCACARLGRWPVANVWRIGILVGVFALHAVANVPNGSAFLRPDDDRAVAAYLQSRLAPTDLVMMGNAHQSRHIPFFLGRAANYGFLWNMSPEAAQAILTETSDRAVGALVLPRQLERFFWRDPRWQDVRTIVETSFEPAPAIGSKTYSVYLRRDR